MTEEQNNHNKYAISVIAGQCSSPVLFLAN